MANWVVLAGCHGAHSATDSSQGVFRGATKSGEGIAFIATCFEMDAVCQCYCRLVTEIKETWLTEPVFEIGFWFEFAWSGREISVDINHDFLSLKRQIIGDTQPSLSFNPLTSMQNSSKFRSPSPSSADCYIIEWYRMAVSAVCADIQETLAFKA